MNAPLLVLYAGAVPVRFNHNHCGHVFELTGFSEATRFPDEAAATKSAARAGLLNYTVQPESEIQP